MRPRTLQSLKDILKYGERIQRIASGKTITDFLSDEMLHDAVERDFEIIGEAMRRVKVEEPEIAARIAWSRRAIGFRNVLAHGYDVIRDRDVWGLIHDDLPKLLAEVEDLVRSG